ncbi:MAG: TolB family protein [Candidatus Hydrogenedentota bacterium]
MVSSVYLLLILAASPLAVPAGEIAFVRGTEQEDRQVCVISTPAGTVRARGPGQRDGAPRWSPDGEWLAFSTQAEGGAGIYVVRHDGAQGRMLSHARRWNHHPRWSPDGKRLAYAASNAMDLDQVAVVYDIEADAETVWGGGRTGLLRPVWLPNLAILHTLEAGENDAVPGFDGARVWAEGHGAGALVTPGMAGEPAAFTTDVFLVTRTQAAPLLDFFLPETARYEEWGITPDATGKRLVFESNDGADREIFLLNDRGIADISNHRAADWNAVWAPDGQFVAFESFRSGRRGVYQVYPETGRVVPVAAGDGYDCWAPAWSPDGAWIAYVSTATGDPELYAVPVGNGDPVRLTEHPGPDLAPAWRPEAGQ